MNKADSLRSKLQDIGDEAVDDIRRVLKNNARQDHELKRPLKVNDLLLKKISHDPHKHPDEEPDLFVMAWKEVNGEFQYDGYIEMDDLTPDDIVHLLNDIEQTYGPAV